MGQMRNIRGLSWLCGFPCDQGDKIGMIWRRVVQVMNVVALIGGLTIVLWHPEVVGFKRMFIVHPNVAFMVLASYTMFYMGDIFYNKMGIIFQSTILSGKIGSHGSKLLTKKMKAMRFLVDRVIFGIGLGYFVFATTTFIFGAVDTFNRDDLEYPWGQGVALIFYSSFPFSILGCVAFCIHLSLGCGCLIVEIQSLRFEITHDSDLDADARTMMLSQLHLKVHATMEGVRNIFNPGLALGVGLVLAIHIGWIISSLLVQRVLKEVVPWIIGGLVGTALTVSMPALTSLLWKRVQNDAKFFVGFTHKRRLGKSKGETDVELLSPSESLMFDLETLTEIEESTDLERTLMHQILAHSRGWMIFGQELDFRLITKVVTVVLSVLAAVIRFSGTATVPGLK